MFDQYPYEFEAVYVHSVVPRNETYGYEPERWHQNEFNPYFFRSYPEAALHAAKCDPPLIRVEGLRRICVDAVKDFMQIDPSRFASHRAREERRLELNQAIWNANKYLEINALDSVEFAPAEQRWNIGDKVSTVYGPAIVVSFDATFNLYRVILDWRSLAEQVRDYDANKNHQKQPSQQKTANQLLQTVDEIADYKDEESECRAKDNETALSDSKTESTVILSHNNENRLSLIMSESGNNAAELYSSPRQEVGESSSESSDSNRRRKPRLNSSLNLGKQGRFCATVSGCSVKPFAPPSLPSFPKTKNSYLFQSLLSMDSKTNTVKTLWNKGESITTPYGPAIVIEHKENQCVVLAKFVGWNARAYLHETSVKRPSNSVIGSFLRQLSGVTPAESKFPLGTNIVTPFGPAKVEKGLNALKSSTETTTVGLRLTSWRLADGSSPMIYCALSTAQAWKESKSAPTLLSTLNNIVTSYGNTLLEPFLSQRKAVSGPSKKFKQYFKDAACVRSKYGAGRIRCFREDDGFYVVHLNGCRAILYARKDELSCFTVDECREGFPVLTTLGLTGTLASVEPTSGTHIVTIRAMGSNLVCYLQPDAIVRPLQASVGDDVVTPYGDGILDLYDTESAVYLVRLSWGARLYTNALDRAGDGTQMRDGSYTVDWIFNLFFRKEAAIGARSRSNSLVSSRSGLPA